MMPNEKNTKRVILALDQAYEKFIQLEDKSTDEAEIVSYRCLYTNIYESKLYVEQMQKEIDRLNELLKEQQPKEPMQLKYSETREEYWFYESICPKCGNRWISNETDHFCPACGQPVFEPCEEEQKDGEQE